MGVFKLEKCTFCDECTVSLSTSLALKWLVPRLSSFQREHPGIALLLDTNDAFTDFDTTEVDVALRFGEPGWDGLYHEQIRHEELIVVAAPSLVEKRQRPMRPEEVANLPLLHDAFNVGWESWASQVGLNSDQINSQSIKYVDSAVLLEAAIDGQGVALARHLLAERDLKFGRLVRLDECRVPLDRGLYFVCRPGDQERVTVRIFKKWLMSI